MTALLPDTGGPYIGEPEVLTPGERADRAVGGILTSLDTAPGRGVVVDSPPGAGKSTLVVKATGHLTSAGHQLMIVAQTNEQVDDLVDRIAREHPGLALGRLHAGGHTLPPRVTRHPNVTGSSQVTDLRDLPVVVSTAKKWLFVTPATCAPWRWAIVDEARTGSWRRPHCSPRTTRRSSSSATPASSTPSPPWSPTAGTA